MNPPRLARRCCLGQLLLLLALFATPAWADREGDFLFDRIEGTAWVSRYVGPGGAVVIPDRLGNLTVANIENGAFHGLTSVTSITIPKSISFIGQGTFFGCTGLTSITIPDSVTNVLDWAFSGCTGLTSVGIPNSVTAFGYARFGSCPELISVTKLGRGMAESCGRRGGDSS